MLAYEQPLSQIVNILQVIKFINCANTFAACLCVLELSSTLMFILQNAHRETHESLM